MNERVERGRDRIALQGFGSNIFWGLFFVCLKQRFLVNNSNVIFVIECLNNIKYFVNSHVSGMFKVLITFDGLKNLGPIFICRLNTSGMCWWVWGLQ